jgi:nucleoside-diphosphate-sugar epimerase
MAHTQTILVTGGAGFLGSLLIKELIKKGIRVVSIDLEKDTFSHPNFTAIQGDIRDKKQLARLGKKYTLSAIFHLAAQMPHAVKNKREFWATNVDGTRNIAELAKAHNIKRVIFTSTNCLWGKSLGRPIREDDPPAPSEIYGKSKLEGENILRSYAKYFKHIIFRCPPIIDDGRAGNIAIFFEFIAENRKVWMVGKGSNRYQMISARDTVDAMLHALHYNKSNTFGIGSSDIPTFREMYIYVIKKANSKSRPASFPAGLIRPAMRTANVLKISPLGIYFQQMIDKDFEFDTSLLRKELGWQPTLNNSEMLYRAYDYYIKHQNEIKSGGTNNQKAKMGIIRVLKWLS